MHGHLPTSRPEVPRSWTARALCRRAGPHRSRSQVPVRHTSSGAAAGTGRREDAERNWVLQEVVPEEGRREVIALGSIWKGQTLAHRQRQEFVYRVVGLMYYDGQLHSVILQNARSRFRRVEPGRLDGRGYVLVQVGG